MYSVWPEVESKSSEPEIIFKPLDASFAPLLNSTWKFRDSKTELMISSLANLGKAWGLFLDSEEKEQPVAWMVMYRYSVLQLVYQLNF